MNVEPNCLIKMMDVKHDETKTVSPAQTRVRGS